MDDSRDEVEREARLAAGRRALEDRSPSLRVEGGLGGSPVPPMEQLRLAALTLLHEVLSDANGALLQVLEQDLRQEENLFGALMKELARGASEDLRRHLFGVLTVLASRPLSSEAALAEFTRRTDAQWGQSSGERPHFQRAGQSPHPDDPYTLESVRASLAQLRELAVRQGR